MRREFDEFVLDDELEERDRIRKRFSFRHVDQQGTSLLSEGSRAFDPSDLDVEDFRSSWIRRGLR